jgi:hypothetical protein
MEKHIGSMKHLTTPYSKLLVYVPFELGGLHLGQEVHLAHDVDMRNFQVDHSTHSTHHSCKEL